MAKKNQFTTKQFIKAIKGSGSIITIIAARVGCDWHTAKKYITQFPTIQKAYDDERETTTDLAEGVVIQNIRLSAKRQAAKRRPVDSGDAKWWLTKKAKDRGYGDKLVQEITGKDGGAIEIEGLNSIIEKVWSDENNPEG